jgi:hypothetical protein
MSEARHLRLRDEVVNEGQAAAADFGFALSEHFCDV